MRMMLRPMLAIGAATLLYGCPSKPSAENNAANVAEANVAAPANVADNAVNAAVSNMAATATENAENRGNPDRR